MTFGRGHVLWADGSVVTVQAGVPVRSMGPRGTWVTTRAQAIRVHGDVYTHSEVCWAGSGGYWNYVEPSDLVEFHNCLDEVQRAEVFRAQESRSRPTTRGDWR